MSEQERKFGETAKFNFDLDKKLALQVIPKDIKDLGIKEAANQVCEKLNLVSNFDKIGGINTINIDVRSEEQGESVLNGITSWLIHNFDKILEEKTGKDRTDFYRSATFFEASIQNNVVNIQWS